MVYLNGCHYIVFQFTIFLHASIHALYRLNSTWDLNVYNGDNFVGSQKMTLLGENMKGRVGHLARAREALHDLIKIRVAHYFSAKVAPEKLYEAHPIYTSQGYRVYDDQ
ncbi:hypothetical protein ACJX0J_037545 [Zea mays]